MDIQFYEEIVLFLMSHLCIIVSSFVTLPYKHLTMWETFKMSIPYAWVSRIFLTRALTIENEMKYLGPTNMVFFLIVSQFTFTLLGNRFYLKEKTSWSELVAFVILIFAYAISMFNVVSRVAGIPVKDASGNLIEGPSWLPGPPNASQSNSQSGSQSITSTSV
jgi:hypothetical protein